MDAVYTRGSSSAEAHTQAILPWPSAGQKTTKSHRMHKDQCKLKKRELHMLLLHSTVSHGD
jgi:hypothetical protein